MAGVGRVGCDWVGHGQRALRRCLSTLVRLYPVSARQAITGIMLIAGFASTVGWPLTAWWIEAMDWRGTCFAWAALHIAIGLPLRSLLPRYRVEQPPAARALLHTAGDGHDSAPRRPLGGIGMAIALAAVFAIIWFTSTAMAAHLPALLQGMGLGSAAALGVAMLVGPAQVAGRLLEFGFLRRVHPLLSTRLAAVGHLLGVVVLLLLGPAGAWPITQQIYNPRLLLA
jgi:predicted MFS family arabinose efflux permease